MLRITEKELRKNAVLGAFSGSFFVENLINYDAFSPDSHECCDEEVKEIGMCVGTYFPGL